MNKKILICSGGTGGHVIPAKNFANYLLDNGFDCYLILDKRGLKYCNNYNGKIYIINASHLSGNILKKIKSIINLIIGFIQILFLLIKIRPANTISFGSYATFMPIFASLFTRVIFRNNIYIHEQNSVIGKVNSFYLKYAKYFFTNFKKVDNLEKKYLNKKIYVGTPTPIDEYLETPNLEKNFQKNIILIYGGSQGSEALINNFLLIVKNPNFKITTNVKYIIQSPKRLHENINNELKKLNLDYEIKDFFNNMNEILLKTNMAFTRAGAGTINDIIRYRIPSIIMPLPKSIYNHQFHNAKYLSDLNAAVLIDEINFDVSNNTIVFENLKNNHKLALKIKKNLKQINLPDANAIMIKKIFYDKK